MSKLILAALLGLLVTTPTEAQKKTDKERHDLRGPVHVVRIENVKIHMKDGQYVEGPRVLWQVHTYDARGNHISLTENDEKGFLKETFSYNHDSRGNVTEINVYAASGSLLHRSVSNYNDEGDKTEMISYGPDGATLFRVVYEYDDKGREASQTYYNNDGSLIRRLVYKYADGGRKVEVVTYSPANTVVGKRISTYDEQGRLIEGISYGAGGQMVHRTVFSGGIKGIPETAANYDGEGNVRSLDKLSLEFDSHGNWVKRTRLKQVVRDGKTVGEPTDITYRTITYH